MQEEADMQRSKRKVGKGRKGRWVSSDGREGGWGRRKVGEVEGRGCEVEM